MNRSNLFNEVFQVAGVILVLALAWLWWRTGLENYPIRADLTRREIFAHYGGAIDPALRTRILQEPSIEKLKAVDRQLSGVQ